MAPESTVAVRLELAGTVAWRADVPIPLPIALTFDCSELNTLFRLESALDWLERSVFWVVSCVIGSDAICTARVMTF
jgi:hypothetical protein